MTCPYTYFVNCVISFFLYHSDSSSPPLMQSVLPSIHPRPTSLLPSAQLPHLRRSTPPHQTPSHAFHRAVIIMQTTFKIAEPQCPCMLDIHVGPHGCAPHQTALIGISGSARCPNRASQTGVPRGSWVHGAVSVVVWRRRTRVHVLGFMHAQRIFKSIFWGGS
jgi:hypothetical protein